MSASEEHIEIPADLGEIAEQLDRVVQTEQPVAAFWEELLESYCLLCGASRSILLVRKSGETAWRKVAYHEHQSGAPQEPPVPQGKFQQWAARAAAQVLESPNALVPVKEHGPTTFLIGTRLRLLQEDHTCAALFLVEGDPSTLRSRIERLQLVSTAPRTYQAHQARGQHLQEQDTFGKVLDLLVPTNEADRFLAAAMALCNETATAYGCERVSLGWWERGFIRLKAISRMEKFNRQMAAAQALEAAMDEALDQNAAVAWPALDASMIARDHEKFCQTHQVGHVLSTPLRVGDSPIAVLSCERESGPFTELEQQQLRLLADLAAPRLVDLHHRDRWWGARAADSAKQRCAWLLGPQNTWAKILALFLMVLLAVLIFVKVPYRVEGDFIVQSEEVAFLTSPFDSYIEEVHREAPAEVTEGELLLTLRTDELRLQEAAELANVAAASRQAERARAVNQLADMRIALAQVQQAEARLAIVRDQLGQAEIRAPFDAVIVEGDLMELRGKPIEKGSPLFKLAQLDKLCVEAKIDERDVHEVALQQMGEIAFVSQPKDHYPIQVTQMQAAAFPEGEGNVFRLKGAFQTTPEAWFRPGMTGVAKIDVGKRRIMWILGHRTVDFFRMWLWW